MDEEEKKVGHPSNHEYRTSEEAMGASGAVSGRRPSRINAAKFRCQ